VESLAQWQPYLLLASGLSLFVMLLTFAAVPWVVARLPHDYFSRPTRATWRSSAQEPAFALVLGLLKNVLGLLLVVLGFIMLFTPGQGLLTLLAGLLLMNFPGKYHMERWLVMRPGVLRAMNWLRTRSGEPPFDAPEAVP
jgi:hypothetical protein